MSLQTRGGPSVPQARYDWRKRGGRLHFPRVNDDKILGLAFVRPSPMYPCHHLTFTKTNLEYNEFHSQGLPRPGRYRGLGDGVSSLVDRHKVTRLIHDVVGSNWTRNNGVSPIQKQYESAHIAGRTRAHLERPCVARDQPCVVQSTWN
jgi:hypothetical protein